MTKEQEKSANPMLESYEVAVKRLEEERTKSQHFKNAFEELQDQLDDITEFVGGPSMHPDSGVSLLDDVKDLMKKWNDLKQESWDQKQVLYKKIASQASEIERLSKETHIISESNYEREKEIADLVRKNEELEAKIKILRQALETVPELCRGTLINQALTETDSEKKGK